VLIALFCALVVLAVVNGHETHDPGHALGISSQDRA
jgi:hypothetical protein